MEIKMAKNVNNKNIYIRDENLKIWEKLDKSDFVNWCLQNKVKEYKEEKKKK